MHTKFPIYFVHDITGIFETSSMDWVTQVISRLSHDADAIKIALNSDSSLSSTPTTIPALARQHIQQFVRLDTKNPIVLVGHSSGGVIAYEMAAQLEQQGYEVQAHLLDAHSPNLLQGLSPRQHLMSFLVPLDHMVNEEAKADIDLYVLFEKYASEEEYTFVELLDELKSEVYKKTANTVLCNKLEAMQIIGSAELDYQPVYTPKQAYLYIAKDTQTEFRNYEALLGWEKHSIKLVNCYRGHHFKLPVLAELQRDLSNMIERQLIWSQLKPLVNVIREHHASKANATVTTLLGLQLHVADCHFNLSEKTALKTEKLFKPTSKRIFANLFEGHDTVVISKQPGHGSRTLAQHIKYQWAIGDYWSDNIDLVLAPSLTLKCNWASSLSEIMNAVATEVIDQHLPNQTALIEPLTQYLTRFSQRTVFLIAREAANATVLDRLLQNTSDQLLSQNARAPQRHSRPKLIVTTETTIPTTVQARQLTLEGFTKHQIAQWLAAHFSSTHPHKLRSLLHLLNTNPEIFELCSNPHLLEIVALTWSVDDDADDVTSLHSFISKITTRIWANYLSQLLQDETLQHTPMWGFKRDAHDLHPAYYPKLLPSEFHFVELLAISALENRSLTVANSRIREIEGAIIEKIKTLPSYSLYHHALKLQFFQPSKDQPKQAKFRSHVFRDFFAARYFSRHQELCIKALKKSAADPEYRTIWRFVFSESKNHPEFQQTLYETLNTRVCHMSGFSALRMRAGIVSEYAKGGRSSATLYHQTTSSLRFLVASSLVHHDRFSANAMAHYVIEILSEFPRLTSEVLSLNMLESYPVPEANSSIRKKYHDIIENNQAAKFSVHLCSLPGIPTEPHLMEQYGKLILDHIQAEPSTHIRQNCVSSMDFNTHRIMSAQSSHQDTSVKAMTEYSISCATLIRMHQSESLALRYQTINVPEATKDCVTMLTRVNLTPQEESSELYRFATLIGILLGLNFENDAMWESIFKLLAGTLSHNTLFESDDTDSVHLKRISSFDSKEYNNSLHDHIDQAHISPLHKFLSDQCLGHSWCKELLYTEASLYHYSSRNKTCKLLYDFFFDIFLKERFSADLSTQKLIQAEIHMTSSEDLIAKYKGRIDFGIRSTEEPDPEQAILEVLSKLRYATFDILALIKRHSQVSNQGSFSDIMSELSVKKIDGKALLCATVCLEPQDICVLLRHTPLAGLVEFYFESHHDESVATPLLRCILVKAIYNHGTFNFSQNRLAVADDLSWTMIKLNHDRFKPQQVQHLLTQYEQALYAWPSSKTLALCIRQNPMKQYYQYQLTVSLSDTEVCRFEIGTHPNKTFICLRLANATLLPPEQQQAIMQKIDATFSDFIEKNTMTPYIRCIKREPETLRTGGPTFFLPLRNELTELFSNEKELSEQHTY